MLSSSKEPANSPSDHDASPTANQTELGLRKSDRRLLLTMCFCTVSLSGIIWIAKNTGRKPEVEIVRSAGQQTLYQIDINSATWVEWMQLEGIGEVTARAIVDDRSANGPFHSIDDVQRVRGIGDVTLDKMRPHLSCIQCSDDIDE
ncbi:ComE operon protein 1 [Thalassoglobus neptunius]|uniref:ComE operon protein 1 n=1 Tax=Thalassoglobus neptunius TaxID=1938619 RepID=A0A5C5X7Y3_9PLAN|nr:helix-hairpin-helix domain-containing protein [Thalassoglobus neptunius]TWT58235.1 ComE operon protein 1 [Thalassoglobus neptunius]